MAAVVRRFITRVDDLSVAYTASITKIVDGLAAATAPLTERVTGLAVRFNLKSRNCVAIASGFACAASSFSAEFFKNEALYALVPPYGSRDITLGLMSLAICFSNAASALIYFKIMFSALRENPIEFPGPRQSRDGHLPA